MLLTINICHRSRAPPGVRVVVSQRRPGFTALPTQDITLEAAEGAEGVIRETTPLARLVPRKNGAPPEKHAELEFSNGALAMEAGLNGLASESQTGMGSNGSVAGNGAQSNVDKSSSARRDAKPSDKIMKYVGRAGSGGGTGLYGGVQCRNGGPAQDKKLENSNGGNGRMGDSHSFCKREFLVPMNLLAEPKIRAILFVYGAFSVRGRPHTSIARLFWGAGVCLPVPLTAATLHAFLIR